MGSALIKAEFFFEIGKSELWKCQEALVLNHYLPLRENFERLQAACDLLQAIIISQLPGKPAEKLYTLLDYYLEKLPFCNDPRTVVSSFYLKTLQYEGIFPDIFHFSQNFLLTEDSSNPFKEEDLDQIKHMAYCRSFMELAQLAADPKIHNTISQLFFRQHQ